MRKDILELANGLQSDIKAVEKEIEELNKIMEFLKGKEIKNIDIIYWDEHRNSITNHDCPIDLMTKMNEERLAILNDELKELLDNFESL